MLREAVQRPDDIKQQVRVSTQHIGLTCKGNLAIIEEEPLHSISDVSCLWLLRTRGRRTDIIGFSTVANIMSRVQLPFMDDDALKVVPKLRYFNIFPTLFPTFFTRRCVRIHVELKRELELCLQLSTTHFGMLELLVEPVSDVARFTGRKGSCTLSCMQSTGGNVLMPSSLDARCNTPPQTDEVQL